MLVVVALLGCSSTETPAPETPAPAPEEGGRGGKQKGGKGKKAGGDAGADTCCCELLPTDVGESTFQVLPKSECTGHGPGGVYDGAKCVEDARCSG